MVTKNLLKFFIRLYDHIYMKISALAMRYYGVHPKHIFGSFHQFFLDHIVEGSSVLDIGCSRGELTLEIARKAGRVVAYDLDERAIRQARKNACPPNITYFVGEATRDMPQGPFDFAILSNILEHLPSPIEHLTKLGRIAKKLLLRVPYEDRNWVVKVKKDLGMNYFSDPTHYREYTQESIRQELEEAGWDIELIQVCCDELRIAAHRRR